MKYKGIIFDMDGVLFDTERLYQETWKEIADGRNIILSPEFSKEISGTNGNYMKQVVEKHYKVSDGRGIMEECMRKMEKKLDSQIPIKPGVYEILECYKQAGVQMAVASSSPVERIERNLRKGRIRDFFSAIVSGKDVKRGKPYPDIFILAARKISCTPSECIVYEDSENGVKAGFAAGCCTIMIPDLIKPNDEMKRMCSEIYSSFCEVLEAGRFI